MTLLHTIILSIVEGFTEFLPVSSTAHLILTSHILGISPTDFTKSFEIVIQLGAICSVLVLYAQYVLKNPKVITKILVSFVPTSIIGLVLYSFIKKVLLENITTTLLALFIGGAIIIALERLLRSHKTPIDDVSKVTYKNAFLIGCAQSISVIPGVSRAAATIFGSLYLGLDRKTAVIYSFLLAVPTMAAATALDLYKSADTFSQADFGMLAIGFVLSSIVAGISIKFLLGVIRKNDFVGFGIYRIVLAVLFFLFFFK